ncbi:MAG: alpha/beta hydrolase [Erysipelotrichaceae bacterium]|nr:alpha/beta hydrolase [Erysipelotrichaceae bacterium]
MKQYPINFYTCSNGETIAYRKAGTQGPVVVLVHGNMSSSVHWQTTMEKLENDFQLIVPDMRGFGDSSYINELNSLYDFGIDLLDLLKFLKVDTCTLVGWSTGGGVVLEMAAELKEKVKKVVLLDSVGLTGYPMFKKDANYQPILTELLTKKEDIAVDPVQVLPIVAAYANRDKNMLKMIWNALIYNMNQPSEADYELYLDAMLKQRNIVDVDYGLVVFNMTHDHNGVVAGSGRMDLITADIVILHGEKDLVVPVMYAHDMKKRFGDKAELVLFENAGHSVITDDLDLFITTLKEKSA